MMIIPLPYLHPLPWTQIELPLQTPSIQNNNEVAWVDDDAELCSMLFGYDIVMCALGGTRIARCGSNM